jgi:hypothetical protein
MGVGQVSQPCIGAENSPVPHFEIVLCEAELLPGTWRELLDELNLLPQMRAYGLKL